MVDLSLNIRYASGTESLEKDVLQRHLKLVWRIVSGVSELTPSEQISKWESVLSTGLEWLDSLTICIPGPQGDIPVRQVNSCSMVRVPLRILLLYYFDCGCGCY